MFRPEDMKDWPKGSDAFVEAFARGLAVIAAFGDGGSDLSITDVATRTGLPRAGARRLLLTLVALDLARERNNRFALTPRILRLGFAYLSSLTMPETAQPLLEQLAEATREMVALSVLDGHDIVYVARSSVRRVLSRHLAVGSRLPAYCTSMGRVLLSGLSPDELDRYLATASFPAVTRYTRTAPDQIRAEIEKARHQGWAIAVQEIELGMYGLAAAVTTATGEIVGAVNISGSLSRHTARTFVADYLPRLKECARTIAVGLPPEMTARARAERSSAKKAGPEIAGARKPKRKPVSL